MKHNLLLLFILFAVPVVYSQEVGVRLGNNMGGTAAIDAVFGTKAGRIHADVSFGKGVAVEVLWDLIYKPIKGEEFMWYAGVGPYIFINDPFHLGACGEIGLEYRFKGAPFAMGVDWRPTLRIIESTDMFWDRGGLNIRYVFN